MWQTIHEYKESGYQTSSSNFFTQGTMQEVFTYFNDDPRSLITSFTIAISVDADNKKTGVISQIKHILTEDNQPLNKLYSAVRRLKYQPNSVNSKIVIDHLKEHGIISSDLHQQIQKQINCIINENKTAPASSQSCLIL